MRPTPEILRQLLDYNPETGLLFWKIRPRNYFSGSRAEAEFKRWNGRYANKQAFTTLDSSGYYQGHIFGRAYLAHIIIWAIQTGEWPTFPVDHKDTNRTNNKYVNLRPSSTSLNAKNRRKDPRNKSGVTGVNWYKPSNKWRAQAVINGKNTHLGLFTNLADAAEARNIIERQLGYDPSHGKDRA